MAAIRATPITSPFFAVPDAINCSVSARIRITPLATATRWVSALAETSTMWACPCSSKCVNGDVIERNSVATYVAHHSGGACHDSVAASGLRPLKTTLEIDLAPNLAWPIAALALDRRIVRVRATDVRRSTAGAGDGCEPRHVASAA